VCGIYNANNTQKTDTSLSGVELEQFDENVKFVIFGRMKRKVGRVI
jgi:hypothetical protein